MHVTEFLFPPGGATGLLHGGTGRTWEAVPDVTNSITGIRGRRLRVQQGGVPGITHSYNGSRECRDGEPAQNLCRTVSKGQ